jgi:hypothetical protein
MTSLDNAGVAFLAVLTNGRDPAEEKKQCRRRLVVDRIDDLVETFIQEHIPAYN